jgi:hypothetical protein
MDQSNISLDMKYISLEVKCTRYLLCEKNYIGQQLDSITELKIKNYEEKCYRRPTTAEQLITS